MRRLILISLALVACSKSQEPQEQQDSTVDSVDVAATEIAADATPAASDVTLASDTE